MPRSWLLAAAHADPAGISRWTIAAVVVAALGSAFVAWQAWETHRVTTLSARALRTSYALAIDGARSRLDQNAPRIDVYVAGISVHAADSADGPGAEIGSGTQWEMPADAARLLRVQALVNIVNLMADRTVHLRIDGLRDPAMAPKTELLLAPADRLSYLLTATSTVSEWISGWAARHGEPAQPCVAEGSVTCADDGDEGVIDTWPLRLSAWPIQPVPGADNSWQLAAAAADGNWFQIDMRPLRKRTYWISQRDQIAMPEPFYDPPR